MHDEFDPYYYGDYDPNPVALDEFDPYYYGDYAPSLDGFVQPLSLSWDAPMPNLGVGGLEIPTQSVNWLDQLSFLGGEPSTLDLASRLYPVSDFGQSLPMLPTGGGDLGPLPAALQEMMGPPTEQDVLDAEQAKYQALVDKYRGMVESNQMTPEAAMAALKAESRSSGMSDGYNIGVPDDYGNINDTIRRDFINDEISAQRALELQDWYKGQKININDSRMATSPDMQRRLDNLYGVTTATASPASSAARPSSGGGAAPSGGGTQATTKPKSGLDKALNAANAAAMAYLMMTKGQSKSGNTPGFMGSSWGRRLDPRSLAAVSTRFRAAEGGAIGPHARGASGGLGRYVKGGTAGQDDKIPAMLSDGEFVFDADTVSALGDGNNAAGASVLEQMRRNIRAHKRSAPPTKIPPKAKKPEQYMKKGAK